jgi:hypothetical protein
VWSKPGRFVDSLHVVGDILTKISVNCVINLHVALLFTCLFLWVSPMHDYNCLYAYGYFPYTMHVCVYFYFSMKSCIYVNYLSVKFYIYVSARALGVYNLIACSSKNLFGIAQYDVGFVTLCFVERMKVFSDIAWPGMASQRHYTWNLIHRPRATMPISSLHQENFTTLKDFFNESSMFSNMSTFSSSTLLLSTMSLKKWNYASMCLVFE